MSWLFHRNLTMAPFKYDYHVADNAPEPHVTIDLVLDDEEAKPVISVPLRQDVASPAKVQSRCAEVATELTKLGLAVEDGIVRMTAPRRFLNATLLTQNREIYV